MKKTISRIITAISCIFIFAIILIVFLHFKKPSYNQISHQMEKYYNRDFEIIDKLTYTTYTDGDKESREQIKCPAVILQDKDNENIKFFAYAYPLGAGDWTYISNYARNLLIYCMNEQEFEFDNEEDCQKIDIFNSPRLILDNTEATAKKLQAMVINFNEVYYFNSNFSYISSGTTFEVTNSTYSYYVMGNKTKDRWLNETSPFCFDTPLEKYQAFLDELSK